MCGFAGLFQADNKTDGGPLGQMAERMGAAIRHRGPDSCGVWADPEAGYAVSHQRLAIVDLSADGAQPMPSRDGRWVLAYNGEVFNFPDIRKELEAKGVGGWRGHSDTEVLVEAIALWGVEATLKKLVGMFAFAVWDRREREVTFARDRFGQKPLYIGWLEGGGVVFGSEIKALRQHPRCPRTIDRQSLGELLRTKCIPGTLSIYRDIHKLLPGCMLVLRAQDTGQPPSRDGFRERLHAYWSVESVYEQALDNPLDADIEEAEERLEALLTDAVRCRLVSDVPLGAFLSGGVDSSLVVALMQANSSQPTKTFSIGYSEKRFNEAVHAKQIAEYLGTDHTEWILSPKDSLDAIPLMPTLFDEPFASVSQVPTYLVAKLARQDVTVALSGDGGDEVFGGYHRHLWAPKLARTLRWPRALRRMAAPLLHAASPCTWAGVLPNGYPGAAKATHLGEKMRKLAGILPAKDFADLHDRLSSYWPENELPAFDPGPRAAGFPHVTDRDLAMGLSRRVMAYDGQTFLPDSVLVKVDRTSMAVSLEARAPLLDHRLVELSWRMPMDWMIQDGTGKRMLRRVLYKHVPREMIERPKMGFCIPIADWLRGELRDWAESLLDGDLIEQQGYLDPKPILRLWRQHLDGVRNGHDQLWPILMFQAWLQAQTE